jgi:hypothetical protein
MYLALCTIIHTQSCKQEVYEHFEDTNWVIRSQKIKDEQTIPWPKEN